MTIECAVCGTSVATDVAVEARRDGDVVHCCSARCADALRGDAGEQAGALPAAPRRLLVAVDGSGPALRAVAHAAMLARLSGGHVRLLYAIEPMGLRGLGEALPAGRLGEVVREVEAALRDDAAAQLRRPLAICEAAGVACDTAIVFAQPVQAILDAAAEADLVVMGSRGRGAVAGALFGSVSHRVVGGARVPVLVVH